MKITKLKTEQYVYIFMIAVLLGVTIYSLYVGYAVRKCSRISLVSPTRIVGSGKIGYHLDFTFSINNRIIDGSNRIPRDIYSDHKDSYFLKNRFFIKVSCENDNFHRIVWDFVVPDTLQYVPANGWDKIPYGLDKKK
jgi:hypothetical protein